MSVGSANTKYIFFSTDLQLSLSVENIILPQQEILELDCTYKASITYINGYSFHVVTDFEDAYKLVYNCFYMLLLFLHYFYCFHIRVRTIQKNGSRNQQERQNLILYFSLEFTVTSSILSLHPRSNYLSTIVIDADKYRSLCKKKMCIKQNMCY